MMTTLSKMLVKGEVCEGSTIFIDATDNKELKYEVVKMPVTECSSACDRIDNIDPELILSWHM
jgi:hypothetical protein